MNQKSTVRKKKREKKERIEWLTASVPYTVSNGELNGAGKGSGKKKESELANSPRVITTFVCAYTYTKEEYVPARRKKSSDRTNPKTEVTGRAHDETLFSEMVLCSARALPSSFQGNLPVTL